MNLICHCNKNGGASTFICIFITKLPARPGWAQKPCFSLKGGPVPVQCAGGCSTPPPIFLPLHAEPVELETDWLCAFGIVILCSRIMSPWLTIMAHSVLLFSSESLNGSLAFNKTAEAVSNSPPRSLSHLSAWVLAIFLITVCIPPHSFISRVKIQSVSNVCYSDHCRRCLAARQQDKWIGGVGLDWGLLYGHPPWMEYIDASLSCYSPRLALPLSLDCHSLNRPFRTRGSRTQIQNLLTG